MKWFERLNQPKKLPLVQQAYVLSVLADLLGQGFALSTALQFLALLMPKYQALLLKVDAALVEGQSLEKSLAQLGFGTKIVAQLFYASRQNRLQQALVQAAQRLDQARLFRKEMAKQLAYPGMMGLCLVGMLFGMRTVILPQVTS
ncbi:MAG: type II secretion system F family protein, partial [Abiotrophia defectiva]